MALRKSPKKKAPVKAKKVKLLKLVKVAPDKHVVELEIEGAPAPPVDLFDATRTDTIAAPAEPVILHDPEAPISIEEERTGLAAWWHSLWND